MEEDETVFIKTRR